VFLHGGASLADLRGEAVRASIRSEGGEMIDLIFVGVTIAFFAIAWAYTLGCDRL
jgi:hypothetical protein